MTRAGLAVAAWACAAGMASAQGSVDAPSLRVPFGLTVEAAVEIPTNRMLPEGDTARTGGLSGVAYDPTRGHWIAIADSRQAMRAYELDFVADRAGFRVTVLGAHEITRAPSAQVAGVLDLEGITVLPNGRIILSSEGDQRTDEVSNPALVEVGKDFAVRFEIPVRDRYLPRLGTYPQRGIRENAGFESLTSTPDGQRLFTGVEEPLRQDDDVPAFGRGARGRIAELVRDGERFVPGREFVYPLEPLRAPTSIEARMGNTGLVDLLAIDEHTLLSLERGFVRGRDRETGAMRSVNDIRIFRVTLGDADDVSAIESLHDAPLARPVTKELLLSLDDVMPRPGGLPQDLENFEAITIGPRLPDGAASVVILSDDNFSPLQKSYALLLRIVPKS